MKIKIPTELKEIKLSQFQKFLKTTKDSDDVDFVNRQLVGIFCNLSDEQVKSILARDFDYIAETITKTINKTSELIPIFNLDGVEYGFIPKIEDLTVGEKVDIDSNINDWQRMDKVMAVCYRPINYKHKDTYLIDDYKGEEKPLDVSLDVAIGCVVFFYNLTRDLVIYIPNFLEEAVVQNPKVLQVLEKNGLGIKTFTQSLEVMFSNLMPLQK
jgi:hypothetical protein